MPKQINHLDPQEAEKGRSVPPFFLGVVDFCLLNAALFSLNYWKRGTLDLSPMYVKLLFAFYGIWVVVSIATRKFHFSEYEGLARGMWEIAKSRLYCRDTSTMARGQRSAEREAVL